MEILSYLFVVKFELCCKVLILHANAHKYEYKPRNDGELTHTIFSRELEHPRQQCGLAHKRRAPQDEPNMHECCLYPESGICLTSLLQESTSVSSCLKVEIAAALAMLRHWRQGHRASQPSGQQWHARQVAGPNTASATPSLQLVCFLVAAHGEPQASSRRGRGV